MGKETNTAKLAAVAKRYRPKGVKIKYKRGKKLGPAYALVREDGSKEMLTPKPVTREALFYYLHECAHFVLRHWHMRIPLWQQEYEAEQWAIATMRREGIPVSRRSMADAKNYVHNIAVAHIERGLPRPPKRVLDWCGLDSSIDT